MGGKSREKGQQGGNLQNTWGTNRATIYDIGRKEKNNESSATSRRRSRKGGKETIESFREGRNLNRETLKTKDTPTAGQKRKERKYSSREKHLGRGWGKSNKKKVLSSTSTRVPLILRPEGGGLT